MGQNFKFFLIWSACSFQRGIELGVVRLFPLKKVWHLLAWCLKRLSHRTVIQSPASEKIYILKLSLVVSINARSCRDGSTFRIFRLRIYQKELNNPRNSCLIPSLDQTLRPDFAAHHYGPFLKTTWFLSTKNCILSLPMSPNCTSSMSLNAFNFPLFGSNSRYRPISLTRGKKEV